MSEQPQEGTWTVYEDGYGILEWHSMHKDGVAMLCRCHDRMEAEYTVNAHNAALAAEREQRNEIERSRDSWYQIANDEREKFGRLMGAIQAHYGNMDKESAERLQNLINALAKVEEECLEGLTAQLPTINEDPVIELK
jgi:hypothetical protein